MSDITNRIKLFHSLYTACLSGAAIFAGISVFLYLYLDIRTAVRAQEKLSRGKYRESGPDRRDIGRPGTDRGSVCQSVGENV